MAATMTWPQRLRFILTTGGLYLGTVGLIGLVAATAYAPRKVVLAEAPAITTPVMVTPKKLGAPAFITLSGKPVRLVIADSRIDLLVDPGYYNASNATWSLSDSRVQYAAMTAPANNASGNTFIYGHATHQVLGPLAEHTPAVGSVAQLYTDNGHVFTYTFESARSFTPDDTSIFNYSGPPILTIQTCTGSVSEWRTLYTFRFQKVAQ